ncbi:MAG: PSD1 and planctomycete cytochrome C domain-containing protein [Planctomycetota bacterium]|nr:PSD1 and planctomycete cytochrome C domain-containing protein [Planctomycetota bacterium]MDA1215188.1 PSD1 and planctomycete cytochrome C domain-containing protein [Planctomycetota bacterium]
MMYSSCLTSKDFRWGLLLMWGLFVSPLAARGADFEPVAKILIRRCLECHNETQSNGGLVLTTRESLHQGGDTGPAIVAGDSSASLLFERVHGGEMPPEKKGTSQKLSDEEIATLKDWIANGAEWPEARTLDLYEFSTEERGGRDLWSLQPIVRADVPRVERFSDRVKNPIDAFILARLEKQEWEPALPANRRELIRRLYFDVVGLPPTFEQIEEFVNDDSPDAYEQRVDELLSSPHYGERWGRYWLDLVRFAETCGYERDQIKPNVWKYRDWVVNSLNDDKPYNRFVLEQLAGDELADPDEQTVIATGFLCLGTWNDEPNDPHEYKYERLEDMVHATSTAFLGMTVKCARCHDHKFDPIPQRDYYRMASAFWAGFIQPGSGNLLGGPDKDQLGYDVFGWTDSGREPAPLHLLKKGDPKNPGPVVEFANLTMIPSHTIEVHPAPADAKTTQRRLQLAEWIVDPANTLTARVMVNRIWQHHFGHGIVHSVNNFGFTGTPPTHPQLLDWLAAEFMQPTVDVTLDGETISQPWSMKRMHKLMLMSSTYRQSSNHPRQSEYAETDYANHYFWKAARRRLDAEAMRDAMLSVSGQIDLRLGGPSFSPTIHPEALEGLSRKDAAWQASSAEEQRRRSLYIFTKRSLLPPLMTTFDFADTTLPCGERDVTTVAPQALALLNNEFVHQQSQALAAAVLNHAPSDRTEQIAQAWKLSLGREPSTNEIDAGIAHLDKQTQSFAEKRSHEKDDLKILADVLPVTEGLVINLRADQGVELDDEGRVIHWTDGSGNDHHARQDDASQRPLLVADAISHQPALRFDGVRRFMSLAGEVVSSQHHTVIAVATDLGADSHREIFSNWNGAAGNSTTSIFLGTTGKSSVRFSDDFTPAGEIVDGEMPFVLTAVADHHDAIVYQNATPLMKKGRPLAARNLKTPYVIGQQGNIDGEYWTGDIAELLVFDRPLSERELRHVWRYLELRYELNLTPPPKDPAQLALESLCHVLLNTNEFLYVD